MLHTIRHGEPSGTPLLIAHGLFGSARNWGVVAKRLSDSREVIAVDMRNHGASPWFEAHGYEDLAADLAEVAAGGPHDVLGHSMGGKTAMVLALTRPELVRKLIVADIAPVAYAHRQSHLIEAMRAVRLDDVDRRSDAAAQLADVPDDGTRAFLLQSLDVKGRQWMLNLDVLDAEMERIVGFPEVHGRFEGPTLFLSGGESDYVRPEHRERIKSLFPKARFASLPGAGHWLHAEKPREFEAAIRAFLDA
ncbi:alpha/beta fold hydrolase [Jannaschia aquimarina]|uniref:YbfF protein n=1 Tax=Jannaschia aquimarina TaxID=935700 RepID=A0A0D1ECT4_9RHOB|nr:alpha/beta fold hydrolase [Jannaschia aquimarina]KIT15539.1 Esterase YbfF [Jannaschia aquimarina]SNT34741.1 Pimeloyl-ACP methyl ester carboxylesterase [Jannaschia aquimarina]